MNRYRAEILGSLPNGMTHTDVYASVLSYMTSQSEGALVTKRRLSGSMISLVVTFQSDNLITARKTLGAARNSVPGFSADTVGFRQVK